MAIDDFTVTADQLVITEVAGVFFATAGSAALDSMVEYQVSCVLRPRDDLQRSWRTLPWPTIDAEVTPLGSNHALVSLAVDIPLPGACTYWIGIAPITLPPDGFFFVNHDGAVGATTPPNFNGHSVNPPDSSAAARSCPVRPTSPTASPRSRNRQAQHSSSSPPACSHGTAAASAAGSPQGAGRSTAGSNQGLLHHGMPDRHPGHFRLSSLRLSSLSSPRPMISIQELRVEFGARVLFDGLSFAVQPRDRIAFAGPNGAGKSTLMKCIAGDPASRRRRTSSCPSTCRIGYLPQEGIHVRGRSLWQEAESAFGEALGLRDQIDRTLRRPRQARPALLALRRPARRHRRTRTQARGPRPRPHEAARSRSSSRASDSPASDFTPRLRRVLRRLADAHRDGQAVPRANPRSCCSTSRPTTSTSTPSAGWRPSSVTTRARSSSSPTTAPCSTASPPAPSPSTTAAPRNTPATTRSSNGNPPSASEILRQAVQRPSNARSRRPSSSSTASAPRRPRRPRSRAASSSSRRSSSSSSTTTMR